MKTGTGHRILFAPLGLLLTLSAAHADAPPSAAEASAETPGPSPTAAMWWKPTARTTAQIQLQGTIDTTVDAQVFDVDGFDVPASKLAELKAKGRKLVCYFSAGSYENWRPDKSKWPASVLGKDLDGWPGEKWVDVRQLSLLKPILAARMDLCKAKGYDAVDPDNVDGYANDTGFPLRAADQLAYNRMLAELAHERGLAIGLKNDLDQIPQLVDVYDFAVNEQCAEYDECDVVKPFLAKNKPVFNIEYNLATSKFCPKAKTLGLSAMKKKLSLDAWLQRCP
jgi:hypothetical protein